MSVLLAAFICLAPIATDGDTFRCSNHPVAIRMVGLDTPELKGCRGRAGRVCVPGDGVAARDFLQSQLSQYTITIEPTNTMSYNRLVAVARTNEGVNLSCLMIGFGFGIAKPLWPTSRYAKRDCPALFEIR